MSTEENTAVETVYFDELPLNDAVIEGITAMGFDKATPIQAASIPPILENRDLIGIAQTGTGKTAAFLIPTLHKLMEMPNRKGIGALIIVPTRELAVQIDQAVEGLSYFTGLSSIAIYGGGDGTSFNREKKALTTGTDIIIATPGRMLSHLNLGYVPLKELPVLILDEADRMLDMGFYNDIIRIISQTPESRQTLLFSATMPDNILNLTRQFQKNPVTVSISLSKPAAGVTQGAYSVFNNQKAPLLANILKGDDWKSVIVFASTKKSVSDVTRELIRRGVNAKEISSDLEQKEREEVLLEFRNRRLPILVATNVVARGIDIDDIEMVVNFDVPRDAEDYVHRIGRTARASRKGTAITFIAPEEQSQFYRIEQLIGQTVNKLEAPASLGETPAYNPSAGGGRNKGSRTGGGGGGKGGGRNNRPNGNRNSRDRQRNANGGSNQNNKRNEHGGQREQRTQGDQNGG
jgi:superfamily II DNA/RNA helicase